ncbi:MAG: glycosyltransferase [Lachnospiraceae bacterium]|nr:glycosyltransferase [Lachnospiraceae bacterium]
MSRIGSLLGRGVRYVRTYGVPQLYRKIQERRKLDSLERPYQQWLKAQQPSQEEQRAQREAGFSRRPRISILVPAYETPCEFLRQLVDSVCAQTYENWELCIADGSQSSQVEDTLSVYLERDSRIRYQRLGQNQGISANTNAALAMADGEYIGLLDHDDLLFPQTLYEVVRALEANPGARAVYTDEDKISFDQTRHFQPHFKPDFNLELLRSNNYICHFFVVERKLAQEAGGFNSAFDGAQDYDFILRCGERAGQMVHIPKILYSWRSHASSTAADPESKRYAYEAGKRAVEAHLWRQGIEAAVLDTANYGFYRVKYGRDRERSQGPRKARMPVLINSFENIHGQKGIKVVYYDKACNNIVTFPKKDVTDGYVLFTCVRRGRAERGFLEELKSVCDRPEVGLACARVYDSRGRLSHEVEMAGVRSPFSLSVKGLRRGYLGYFHRACLQQEILGITDCFFMRAELFSRLARLYREESCKETGLTVDWLAEKVRSMGFWVVYDPWAVLNEGK